MARQKNPAATVIAFFETADLAVAETVLGLARATVQKRQPTKRTKTKKPQATVGGPAPIIGQPLHDPTERTAGGTPKPPRRRKPQDVPLPGLPGPVSEVGG